MKFLFHFYDLHHCAGIQRAIIELSNALVGAGHEVVIAVNTPRAKVVFPLDERVVLEGISNPEPNYFGLAAWPRRTAWAFRELFVLQNLVRHYRPSIVVDHGTALGLLYPSRSLNGVPFVLQRHFPVGGFPHGKLLHRLLSIFSSAKTVVALTESIAEEMRFQGQRRVVVIPNVLPDHAKPSRYQNAVPRTGLLVGRAKTPQKGFDLFLRALALTKMEGWHFRIVGPDVDSDPLLLTLVKEHQLQDRVELLPPSDDLFTLLSSCCCLIMPSRYEALPMVALEALSIGRPVLASDVDGLRDIVRPGVNGILFPSGDIEELSDALRTLEMDAERLEYFAGNASESVRRFQGPAVVSAWCCLVRQLTQKPEKLSTPHPENRAAIKDSQV
jgi:glycosyltransferase involved in cell wall biosynthesis